MYWDQVYHHTSQEAITNVSIPLDYGHTAQETREAETRNWYQIQPPDASADNSCPTTLQVPSFDDYFFTKENDDTLIALGLREGQTNLPKDDELTLQYLNQGNQPGDTQSTKGGSSTFFLINNNQQFEQEDGKLSHEENNEEDLDYQEEEDPEEDIQEEAGSEEEEADPMEDDLDVFYNEEDYNPALPSKLHSSDHLTPPLSPEPLAYDPQMDTTDHVDVVPPKGKTTNMVYKRSSLNHNSTSGLDSKVSSSSAIKKLTNLEMNKSDSCSHSSKRKNQDSVVDTATSDALGTKKPKLAP